MNNIYPIYITITQTTTIGKVAILGAVSGPARNLKE